MPPLDIRKQCWEVTPGPSCFDSIEAGVYDVVKHVCLRMNTSMAGRKRIQLVGRSSRFDFIHAPRGDLNNALDGFADVCMGYVRQKQPQLQMFFPLAQPVLGVWRFQASSDDGNDAFSVHPSYAQVWMWIAQVAKSNRVIRRVWLHELC